MHRLSLSIVPEPTKITTRHSRKAAPHNRGQDPVHEVTSPHKRLRHQADSPTLLYHLHTLLLFTLSDLKTILLPETLFALSTSLSGSVTQTPEHASSRSAGHTFLRLPLVLLWIYANLLPFNIKNQSQPSSLSEDALNKPWRPLPTKRISRHSAKKAMVFFYALAVVISIPLGAVVPSLTLVALGIWYNDLGGADASCVVRNLINGAGFTTFGMGATIVANGGSSGGHLNMTAYEWLAIIFFVVVTSVQMQDIPDQEGDRQRGRNTVPLVIGDRLGRWSVAVPVALVSVLTPAFWRLGYAGWAVPMVVGSVVIVRLFACRTVGADKTTFRLWNLWMGVLYLLPLFRSLGSV